MLCERRVNSVTENDCGGGHASTPRCSERGHDNTLSFVTVTAVAGWQCLDFQESFTEGELLCRTVRKVLLPCVQLGKFHCHPLRVCRLQGPRRHLCLSNRASCPSALPLSGCLPAFPGHHPPEGLPESFRSACASSLSRRRATSTPVGSVPVDPEALGVQDRLGFPGFSISVKRRLAPWQA